MNSSFSEVGAYNTGQEARKSQLILLRFVFQSAMEMQETDFAKLQVCHPQSTTVTHTMASLAEQPYSSLFTQQQHTDDYTSYPEPPQNAFASASPMDIGVTYPPTSSSLGFEPSLYAETPNYILNAHTSPGAYPEDGDMRLSSSGLSSSSIPSAPSSAVGSPQSNHGQLGLPDWNNHTMTVQPGIVGNDYMAGAEYFHGPSMEDFGSFDFGQSKSFVGKLSLWHLLACLHSSSVFLLFQRLLTRPITGTWHFLRYRMKCVRDTAWLLPRVAMRLSDDEGAHKCLKPRSPIPFHPHHRLRTIDGR